MARKVSSRARALATLAGFLVALADPQAAVAAPRAVLFLVDGLTLADLREPAAAPLRSLLATRGGAALANVRPAAEPTMPAAYLSLGAGARAVAGDEAGLAFNVDEEWRGQPAGVVYSSLTGRAPPAGGVVHLAAPLLAGENQAGAYRARPGLLGDAARGAGLRVAVLGNADVPASLRRYGTLVAMDGAGRVEAGDVGAGLLASDPAWPFLLRTDYRRLREALDRELARSHLVVVELGDLARLDTYASLLSPGVAAAARTAALERITALIRGVSAGLAVSHERWLLLLAAPTGGQARRQANLNLSLLGMARFPEGEPGPLLVSASTRRPGLVTAQDVLPTLLQHLGVPPPPGAGGRVLEPYGQGGAGSWEELARLEAEIITLHGLRPPVIRSYLSLQLATLVLWAGWAFLRRDPTPAGNRALGHLLLWQAGLPLAFLLLNAPGAAALPGPAVPGWRLLAVLAAAGALGALVASLSWLGAGAWACGQDRGAGAFALVSLATAGFLGLDLLRGAPWMRRSLLGYDAAGGARYYGIGNEYMGVLVGAVLVGASYLVDRLGSRPRARWLVGGLFLLAAAFVAFPSLGANVGGTLTAGSAFGLAYLLLGGRLRPLRVGAGLLLLGGLVGGLAWWDAGRPDPSHLGAALVELQRRGPASLLEIAARKAALNLRLARVTIWSRVFLLLLALAGYLLLRPPTRIRSLYARRPGLLAGTRGALAGSVVALVANDSGVVAAATVLLHPVLLLLALAAPGTGDG